MKTQSTLKVLFLLGIAAAISSCSTESKFAMHIHRGDMVRADKHQASVIKHEKIKKEKSTLAQAPIIDNNAIASLEVISPILSRYEVAKINLETSKTIEVSNSPVIADHSKTKTNFIQKIKTIKKINRVAKENKVQGGNDRQIIEVLCAIFIPPLGVFLHSGLGTEFIISIILTILGFLPGVIYALLVVLDVI